MDDIEIKIKMPMDWFDPEIPGMIGCTVREEFEKALTEAVKKRSLKFKIPEVNITKEELKSRILDKMAERALRKYDDMCAGDRMSIN